MKSAFAAKRLAPFLFALYSVLDVRAALMPLAVGVTQPPGTVPPTSTVPSLTPTVTPPSVLPVVKPPVVLPPVVKPVFKIPAVRVYPPLHFGDNRIRRPAGAPSLIGDPLPDLTIAQMNQFLDGKDGFKLVQKIEAGLGPIFNGVSCVACHSSPIVGGGSTVNTTRFGQNVGGRFDPLDSLGGSILQEFAIHPAAMELVPGLANVVTKRNSTPIFGLGLIEAIPDSTIIANARWYGNDQIGGRVGWVTDLVTRVKRVGRFGWKAQHATLLAFSADAYQNEMGITNKHFPVENAPNGNFNLLNQHDTRIDPEDSGKGRPMPEFESVANFMRFLGAPPASKLNNSEGRNLFATTGCTQCHTPMLKTGSNPVVALNYKEVWLYSDLLLHNMGSLGDGIVQETATGKDFRTPPLWGASFSAPYLHDGRAPTIDAAIRAHDGEGRLVKERYQKLPATQQKLLTDFVLSL
jgi:mono/diheme cytochrome c family protein